MVQARVKCPYEGEYYLMSIPDGYEVAGTHAEDGAATTSWGKRNLK